VVYGPVGAETDDTLCANMMDDDDNGYVDCEDFWCRDSVAVTVCGSLENTPERCLDGVDNPESPGNPNTQRTDGLTDCADPDCSKNPALTGVCPPLRWELGNTQCTNQSDDDGDGLTDCADPDCFHAGSTACTGRKRILFDDAHRQRAGSADWVVDVAGAHPFPSSPAGENDWAGALSSFGKALLDTGRFSVEVLPTSSGRFTFADPANPQDLTQYDVLVLIEPSAPLSDAEADALLAFMTAGGGVLVAVDHFDSDRDGNGWDSVQALNAVLQHLGGGTLEANPLGLSVQEVDYAESGVIQGLNNSAVTSVAAGAQNHPVLSGVHGMVSRVGMYRGGLLNVFPAVNSAATVLMHALPLGTTGYESGSPYVVVTQVGSGRMVLAGDSAILNDGSDSHGFLNVSFDSWHDSQEDNAALFLNAVEWLAE